MCLHWVLFGCFNSRSRLALVCLMQRTIWPTGYSPNGLPMYSSVQPRLGSTILSKPWSILWKSLWENRETRQIFALMCLNFTFMVVEFTYGMCSSVLFVEITLLIRCHTSNFHRTFQVYMRWGSHNLLANSSSACCKFFFVGTGTHSIENEHNGRKPTLER